jgi:hypothetical protein
MPFVLSLMFWYFPARRMKWIDVWPAAGLTAGLLSASRYLIDLYLSVSTSSEVYGAAGSLVMLLVWVYLTGMILFFGAAFSCAWTKRFGSHALPAHQNDSVDNSLLKGVRIKLPSELGWGRKPVNRTQDSEPRETESFALKPDDRASDSNKMGSLKIGIDSTKTDSLSGRHDPRDIAHRDGYNHLSRTNEPGVAQLATPEEAQPIPPLTPQRRHWSATVAAEVRQIKRLQTSAIPDDQIPLRRRSA